MNFKRTTMAIITLSTFAIGFFVSPLTYAAATPAPANPAADQVCAGIATAANNTNCNGTDTSLNSIIGTSINIFSIIIGIVAVVMIMVAGFKYITSNGDSGQIGSAKTTLIYAIIGLVIVALAQSIVHFVVYKTVHG